MRNKIFIGVFCCLILAVMVGAPVKLLLTNAGIVTNANVGNVIEIEKVYEEGTFGASLFNRIEEVKRDINDIYTNYIPFYVAVTSAASEVKTSLNQPVAAFLTERGSRVSGGRRIFNIFVVWFLTGLWHGASWNFVLWGIYFGILLVLEKLVFLKWLRKCRVLNHIRTLFFIVCGWVIFTQEEPGQLVQYTKALFGGYGFLGTGSANAVLLLQRADVNTVFFIMLAAAILFSMPIGPRFKEMAAALAAGNGSVPARAKVPGYVYDAALIAVFLLCTVQFALGSYNPFIYFRF